MGDSVRFWRWYRTIPILAMALAAALSLGLISMPGSLIRRYMFPVHYESLILDSSSRHGVDPLLACAIIKCESNWDTSITSDAGAVGLMQLMPATSAEAWPAAGFTAESFSFSLLKLKRYYDIIYAVVRDGPWRSQAKGAHDDGRG